VNGNYPPAKPGAYDLSRSKSCVGAAGAPPINPSLEALPSSRVVKVLIRGSIALVSIPIVHRRNRPNAKATIYGRRLVSLLVCRRSCPEQCIHFDLGARDFIAIGRDVPVNSRGISTVITQGPVKPLTTFDRFFTPSFRDARKQQDIGFL